MWQYMKWLILDLSGNRTFTKLFKEIFAFYLRVAMELNIYKYENYDENPLEYCGMILSSTII